VNQVGFSKPFLSMARDRFQSLDGNQQFLPVVREGVSNTEHDK
jgi:hypothetical protein